MFQVGFVVDLAHCRHVTPIGLTVAVLRECALDLNACLPLFKRSLDLWPGVSWVGRYNKVSGLPLLQLMQP
jgi:hypothetical protein